MAQHNINSRVILLNETKANWDIKADKFVLLKGEIGIESDTNKFKIGDGVSTWAELEYAGGGSGSSGDVIVPTKVSELENDVGFITSYTETDPTVPDWAKEPTKPSYTADEVGALPNTTTRLPNPEFLVIKQNGEHKCSYNGSSYVEIDLDTGGEDTPPNYVSIDTNQEISGVKIFNNGLVTNNIKNTTGQDIISKISNMLTFGNTTNQTTFRTLKDNRIKVIQSDDVNDDKEVAYLSDIPLVQPLYDTTGQNTDGSMTQKAITDILNSLMKYDSSAGITKVGNIGGADYYIQYLKLSIGNGQYLVFNYGITPTSTTSGGNVATFKQPLSSILFAIASPDWTSDVQTSRFAIKTLSTTGISFNGGASVGVRWIVIGIQ